MRRITCKMEFLQNGHAVFACTPVIFRRVHCLCPNSLELKYSHTDLVVRLADESEVMVEIIQGILSSSTYQLQMGGHTFPLHFSQRTAECVNWIKKMVFACYPDLPVCDMYAGNVLSPRV